MRKIPKSQSKILRTTVSEYAGASTAHGIAYIFEHDRLAIERVFWIVAVIVALVVR